MSRFLVFLFLCCCAILCHAAENGLLLWKVTHPEQPGALYLAGTVHQGTQDMYPLDQAYDNALKDSACLIFEIADPNPADFQLFIMRHGVYRKPEETLMQTLGEKEFQDVVKILKELSVPLPAPMLPKVRPWLAYMLIDVAVIQNGLGHSPDYGYESVFKKNAQGKPFRSLETTEEQLAVFVIPDVEKELIHELKTVNLEEIKKEAAKLMEGIRKADESVLLKQQEEIKTKAPALYQNLIVRRNRKMAGKLFDMMKKKETGFVLVGVAHFTGPDSINRLLEKKGCKVVRLPGTGRTGTIR